MKLPEKIDTSELHWTEQVMAPSVTVLVRVSGFKHPMIGRYFYGHGAWQIDGLDGDGWSHSVRMWWPLPPDESGNEVWYGETDEKP